MDVDALAGRHGRAGGGGGGAGGGGGGVGGGGGSGGGGGGDSSLACGNEGCGGIFPSREILRTHIAKVGVNGGGI